MAFACVKAKHTYFLKDAIPKGFVESRFNLISVLTKPLWNSKSGLKLASLRMKLSAIVI